MFSCGKCYNKKRRILQINIGSMFKAAIFLWFRSNTHERKNYLLWVFHNRDSELYLQRSSTLTNTIKQLRYSNTNLQDRNRNTSFSILPAVASNASLNYYKNVYIGKDILDFCLSNSQTFPNSNPSKTALDGRRLFSVYRKIRFWNLSCVGETFLEPIAIVSDPPQKSLRINKAP